MNKAERFLSMFIPVSKRLPKATEDIDDPTNDILTWVPPMQCFPQGRFYVRKAGLFVMQQEQLRDNPDMYQRLLDQSEGIEYNGYYSTHWMNLYRPKKEK